MEFLADLHSEVIHFPIAFLIAYQIMELIALSTKKKYSNKAAMLLFVVGIIEK